DFVVSIEEELHLLAFRDRDARIHRFKNDARGDSREHPEYRAQHGSLMALNVKLDDIYVDDVVVGQVDAGVDEANWFADPCRRDGDIPLVACTKFSRRSGECRYTVPIAHGDIVDRHAGQTVERHRPPDALSRSFLWLEHVDVTFWPYFAGRGQGF